MFAMGAVAISTLAVFVAIVTIPAVFMAMYGIHSEIDRETEFCTNYCHYM